jgi:hypothetical protein
MTTCPKTLKSQSAIGKDNKGGFLDGDLEEIRIWSFVLDLTDILRQVFSGNEPRLVAYWPIDEGTGSKVVDISSNQYTGTFTTNKPVWIYANPGNVEELPLINLSSFSSNLCIVGMQSSRSYF